MPTPLSAAARVAVRLAKAARKAEKTATTIDRGELAAAVAQLRKSKKSSTPTDTAAHPLPKLTDTAARPLPKSTDTASTNTAKPTKTAKRDIIKASETAIKKPTKATEPTETAETAETAANHPKVKKSPKPPKAKKSPKPPKPPKAERPPKPPRAKGSASKKSTKAAEHAGQDELGPDGLPVLEQDISDSYPHKNLSSYRNSLSYYVHPDYPIGQSLNDAFPDKNYGPAAGKDKFPDRVDVVSEPLCDEIINYLGHDLDQHKGCDIIDLHPGACLWSQKIHQRLKPRRHLLLEPEEGYLEPFIKPLLNQKDSTYRHTTLSGAAPKGYFDTYDKIFNDDLLPKRDPLPDSDPRLREPNNTLLVIGSLVRRYPEYRASGSNQVSFPSMVLHQMAEVAQINTMFQRYGLVRLLLWIPDELKQSALPDSVMHKSGFAVNVDSSFDLAEVVGNDRSQLSRFDAQKKAMHKQRQDQLEVWGAQRVLERMRSKGMSIPEHRRPNFHQKALDTDDETLEAYNPIRLPKDKPLQTLLADHEDQVRKLQEFAATPRPQRKRMNVPAKVKLTNVSQEFIVDSEHESVRYVIDVWGEQIALEHEYSTTKTRLSEEIRKDVESRLVEASNIIASVIQSLFNIQVLKQMRILLDEYFALCKPNQMLQWDRRPFESMTVAVEEFWPRFPMRLLDLKPRSEALGDDLMNPTEATHVKRGLLKALFTHPSAPLLESIDRLGPGARDILPPEFKDSTTGGMLNPEHMLTKNITREQLIALTKAYIEWPFRPLGSEALEATDSEVV